MGLALATSQPMSKAAAARALGIPVSTYKDRLRRGTLSQPAQNIVSINRRSVKAASQPRRDRGAEMATGAHRKAPPRAARGEWYAANNRVVFDDGDTLELERLPQTVLHWSCAQSPFEHQDCLPFLSTVAATYKPDLVVMHGDEADLEFAKFQKADSMSPIAELEHVKGFVRDVARIFPRMLLLTSNHIHSRIKGAQAKANIPTMMLRDWPSLIGAPEGWTWRSYVVARDWLWEHGHDIGAGSRGSVVEETVRRFGRPLSIMRGHRHGLHGDFVRPIWITPTQQARIFYVGCLMSKFHVSYTRSPLINGCAITYRGHPLAIPMEKDRNDRWTGRLVDWN